MQQPRAAPQAVHGELQAKGRRRPGPWRKPHVIAKEIGRAPHTGAEALSMKGTSGQIGRSIFMEERGEWPRQPGSNRSCESAVGERRERQGCQRYGLGRERAEQNAASPTRADPPKRIGRHETPGSPVPWRRVQVRVPRARREPRRDAGNTRGAGARCRSSGKQKSVARIVLVFRLASQDTRQERRASSKRVVSALTRLAMGPEKGSGFERGRERAGKARVKEVPQRRWYKPASERIGVRNALRAVKSAGVESTLSGAARHWIGPAETPG